MKYRKGAVYEISIWWKTSGGGRSELIHPLNIKSIGCYYKNKFSKFLSFFYYKSAFTLAEVLITLGIIGVVAALTMPALVSLYQKKIVETRLAHTYSLISQALKMAEADYGDSQYWMRDAAGPYEDNSDLYNVMNTFFKLICYLI